MHKMWLPCSVCAVVGIFATFYVGLAISAEGTEELARGNFSHGVVSLR